jgi:hypothetical protein
MPGQPKTFIRPSVMLVTATFANATHMAPRIQQEVAEALKKASSIARSAQAQVGAAALNFGTGTRRAYAEIMPSVLEGIAKFLARLTKICTRVGAKVDDARHVILHNVAPKVAAAWKQGDLRIRGWWGRLTTRA